MKWKLLLPLLVAFAAAGASAAGTVEVGYVQPDRFADIGRFGVERERNLASLSAMFESLGKQLPEGQHLQLQVLDVDLAGNLEPVATRDLRIVRGGADWPRMTLKYTLKSGSQTLKSGQSDLSDLGYTWGLATLRNDDPLHYEKRMVEDWFKQTIIGNGSP